MSEPAEVTPSKTACVAVELLFLVRPIMLLPTLMVAEMVLLRLVPVTVSYAVPAVRVAGVSRSWVATTELPTFREKPLATAEEAV